MRRSAPTDGYLQQVCGALSQMKNGFRETDGGEIEMERG
jgi:hypothetical protein